MFKTNPHEASRGVSYEKKKVEPESRLPKLPKWYRAATSLTCSQDVDIEKVKELLCNNTTKSAEVAADEKSSSLKGVVYTNGSKVNFEVNMFANSAAETVVEFARLSGCTIEFNIFFQEMRQLFSSKSMTVAKKEDSEAEHEIFGVAPKLELAGFAFEQDDTREAIVCGINQCLAERDVNITQGFELIAATANDEGHGVHLPAVLALEDVSAGIKEAFEVVTDDADNSHSEDVLVAAATAAQALSKYDKVLAWMIENTIADSITSKLLDVAGSDKINVLAKRELLHQLVLLVSNAIKHAAAGEKVVIQQAHKDKLKELFKSSECTSTRYVQTGDMLQTL